MKILKPGREPKAWSAEVICTGAGNRGGGCFATLLIEQDDIFRTESTARDETTVYATFKCGACGCWTDIARKSLPFAPREQTPADKAGVR